MKIALLITVVLLSSFFLSGCNNNSKNNTEDTNKYNVSRTDVTRDVNDNNSDKEIKEEEISSFSTPLKSGAPTRITNIKLTCNKINGRVLKPGESFSFNEIVGPCTAEEGYKKAEIYINKKIAYALGGGNCQVSTTLYNAVLAVPGIDVTERHEHNGRAVDYIEDGKDATVSYNTKDLKFVNNTGKEIKLYTWCDDVNVLAKITQIQ
jgi:vancomycin resistance protein YoaR